MPKLFKKDTGQPVYVSDDQVAAALASGEYGFEAGKEVVMKSAEGKTWGVQPEQVTEMMSRGFRLEGEGEQKKRTLEKEYGGLGGEIAAALLGAGRGVSFGFSDVALTELGVLDPKTLRDYKEANPSASLGGELTGIGGSLLMGGAGAAKGGKLIKLLRGTTAAPRQVAKLGTKIEQAAARSLKSIGAGKGVQKIGGMAAGGAVEGSLYGAGQLISEDALGEVDLNAESLTAYMGAGAVFGGLAGGGFSLTSQVGRRVLTGGKNLYKRSAKSIVGMWEKQTGNKAQKGLVEALEKEMEPGMSAKVSGMISGKDPKKIDPFIRGAERKVKREIATSGMEVRDTAAYKFKSLKNTMMEVEDELIEKVVGKHHDAVMRDMAKRDIVEGVAEAHLLFRQSGESLGWLAKFDDMVERGAPEFEFQVWVKKLRARAKVIDDKLDNYARGKGKTGDLFNEVHEFKQAVGKYHRRMLNKAPDSLTGAERATMEEMKILYEDARQSLLNPRAWGDKAVRFEQKMNAAWEVDLENIRRRTDHRFVESWKGGEAYWEKGQKARQAKAQGFRKWVDDMGSAKNAEDTPWIMDQMHKREKLLDTINEVRELLPEEKTLLYKWKDARREFIKLHDDTAGVVGLQNQLNDITGTGQGLFSSTAALGGGIGAYALTGDETTAAGVGLAALMLSAMSRPGKAIHSLATLDRIVKGWGEGIGRRVGNYIQNIKRAGVKAAKPVKKMIAPAAVKIPAHLGILQGSNFGDRVTRDKTRRQAFHRRALELNEIMGNPALAADRLAWNTGQIQEVAPKHAAQIQMVGMRAAAFLHSKLPKDPGSTMLRRKWDPSDAELSTFEKYTAATLKPETVLDDLAAGRITREGVEAWKAVYPNKFEEIRAELATRIEEIREDVPYDEKIQLAIFFDLPTDETMIDSFLAAMIPAPTQPMQQGKKKRKGPGQRKGDFRKMKTDDLAQTEAQGVASRRSTA